MTPRRRLLAAASATLAITALSGCEKPAPLVTLVSGGESVYSEASLFCFEEGQTLEDGCSERASEVRQLAVREGERIGIDVDKELTERGWRLQLLDPTDPQSGRGTTRITEHYLPFAAPGIAPGGKLLLTVQTLDPQDQPTGEWQFELVNRE